MATAVASKTPKDYLREPYSRILIPDEDSGTYAAEILEFPGCHAEGKTPNEAIEKLEAAAEGWIEAALELGQEIPEPQMNQGYSGKFALRLPRGLHRQAARLAEHEDTSLNQAFVSAIAVWVGAQSLYAQLAERLEQRSAIAPTVVTVYVNNWSASLVYSRTDLPIEWKRTARTTLDTSQLPLITSGFGLQ